MFPIPLRRHRPPIHGVHATTRADKRQHHQEPGGRAPPAVDPRAKKNETNHRERELQSNARKLDAWRWLIPFAWHRLAKRRPTAALITHQEQKLGACEIFRKQRVSFLTSTGSVPSPSGLGTSVAPTVVTIQLAASSTS